tara:strand:+ start:311 stop:715 length:405 start_codon:yes stop_codon:yes gene_type:complete
MNKYDQKIKFSNNFRDEEKALEKAGIKTWGLLNELPEKDLSTIIAGNRSSLKRLTHLKIISSFVCEMSLLPNEAALLLYSGIPSIKSLSSISPQDLVIKTGRMQRQLNSNIDQTIDLKKANYLIKAAILRQKNK